MITTICIASLSARRAWIEIIDYIIDYATDASLSARRAWIEITCEMRCFLCLRVALRKESVDRNLYYGDDLTFADVALRKESVDRNLPTWTPTTHKICRSPQGERG